MKQYFYVFSLSVFLLLIACSTGWSKEEKGKQHWADFLKKGRENNPDPIHTISQNHDDLFTHSSINIGIDLEEIDYANSVDGKWRLFVRPMTQDNDEELGLYYLVVSYENEDDYEKIKNFLALPLKDSGRAREEHNIYQPRFKLKDIKKKAFIKDAACWFSYKGDAEIGSQIKLEDLVDGNLVKRESFDEKSGKKIVKEEQDGTVLQPLTINSSKFYFTIFRIYEESGYRRVIKIKELVEEELKESKELLDAIRDDQWKAFIKIVDIAGLPIDEIGKILKERLKDGKILAVKDTIVLVAKEYAKFQSGVKLADIAVNIAKEIGLPLFASYTRDQMNKYLEAHDNADYELKYTSPKAQKFIPTTFYREWKDEKRFSVKLNISDSSS